MEALSRLIGRSLALLAASVGLSLVLGACSLATESGDEPAPSQVGVDGDRAAGTVGASSDGGELAEVTACEPGALDQPTGSVIAFYAQCIGETSFLPHPVFRPDPGFEPGQESAQARLELRLEVLVAGTTAAERAAGLSTGFDGVEEAAEVDVLTTVSTGGEAQVEFVIDRDEWSPGSRASTSAQLSSFLDPLLATVFDDSRITAINLDDLCWGEMGCGAGVTTRADWEAGLFINAGLVVGGSCDVAGAWGDADRCTIDGAIEAATAAARVVDVADDDTLNLRAGPGVEYPIVGEAQPEAVVIVADRAAEAADGGVWRLIADNGTAGWVNTAFLDIEGSADEALVEAMVAFARDPSDASFAGLTLADEVQLGLGPDLLATVPGDDLRSPAAWQLDVDEFRAYTGPFSALDVLSELAAFEVTIGPHPHCAADPIPAPPPFTDDRRVSAQPMADLITSCLEWSTVDFFLDADGSVAAITPDLWEP